MSSARAVIFSSLAALLVPATAIADQFVVTDVTYTHSAETTTDSHYRVLPSAETPADWTAPVNYATSGGTAHVRLEVFSKPTAVPTRFQICFEATPSYACTDQAPAYTTTGVYDWTSEFPSFYQFADVDWSKGIVKAALILKDTQNQKPAPENVGAEVSAMYMPTDLRVTVTIVAPGSTYQPPPEPPAPAPDAGIDAAAAEPDASTPPPGPVDTQPGGCSAAAQGEGARGALGGGGGVLAFGAMALLLARRGRPWRRCQPARR